MPLLYCGFEYAYHKRGAEPEETMAHLAALAVHLENVGKSEEAAAYQDEHNELAARMATKKQ